MDTIIYKDSPLADYLNIYTHSVSHSTQKHAPLEACVHCTKALYMFKSDQGDIAQHLILKPIQSRSWLRNTQFLKISASLGPLVVFPGSLWAWTFAVAIQLLSNAFTHSHDRIHDSVSLLIHASRKFDKLLVQSIQKCDKLTSLMKFKPIELVETISIDLCKSIHLLALAFDEHSEETRFIQPKLAFEALRQTRLLWIEASLDSAEPLDIQKLLKLVRATETSMQMMEDAWKKEAVFLSHIERVPSLIMQHERHPDHSLLRSDFVAFDEFLVETRIKLHLLSNMDEEDSDLVVLDFMRDFKMGAHLHSVPIERKYQQQSSVSVSEDLDLVEVQQESKLVDISAQNSSMDSLDSLISDNYVLEADTFAEKETQKMPIRKESRKHAHSSNTNTPLVVHYSVMAELKNVLATSSGTLPADLDA